MFLHQVLLPRKNNTRDRRKKKKISKGFGIGQIGATAGATLRSFITAIGIGLIVLSSSLGFGQTHTILP